MTHEERLMKIRVSIARNERFVALAGLLMVGDCKIVDDMPTAETNGRDVYIGRQFMDTLDDKTLRFVVLHEYYHILFMHMITWKKLWDEDAELANIAADMVINIMLDKQAGSRADNWLKVWPHAHLDYQYDGLDTGEIYRRLKQGGAGRATRSASGGMGQPMDAHRPAAGQDAPQIDPGQLTPAEAAAVSKAVDSALRQGAVVAGKIGAKVDRSVQDLLEVVVDYREVLRDFLRSYTVGDDLSTWRRPSRRGMALDVMMPSRYSESVRRITIGVDTSGSIGQAELRRALSEVVGACEAIRPDIVDIIYWDAEVAAHEIYEGDAVYTLAQSTKPKGGGGTDPTAMQRYMETKDIKPDCIIQFTDGFVGGQWGQWGAPVLWCISTKGITAPQGVSVYVPV